MVDSCCVVGCKSDARKKMEKVSYFRFPAKDKKKRDPWVKAVRRENWSPSNNSRVCSKHFRTGRPSKDSSHPDYKPNIFPTSHVKASSEADVLRYDRAKCRAERNEEKYEAEKRARLAAAKLVQDQIDRDRIRAHLLRREMNFHPVKTMVAGIWKHGEKKKGLGVNS